MKKLWIITIAVLWILAGVQVVQSYNSGEKEKIMEVFGVVGTMEQNVVVKYEGILAEEIENKKAFLEENVNKCELKTEHFETAQTQDGDELLAVTENGKIRLLTRTTEEGKGQYLFIELNFLEEPEMAFTVRKALDELLSSYLSSVQSSVNVIGSYSGRLTLEQRNRAADYLLDELDAEIVSEHRDMELYTIYGYTPYISEYQLQKGQPVNVNLAMYYQEEEDRTYLYAAVPVIGVEY